MGKLFLKITQLLEIGLFNLLIEQYTKIFLLSKIAKFPPIPAGNGMLEVHMLLNHAMVFEGMWSIYSLLFVAEKDLSVIVHDDGSLSVTDQSSLQKTFPGIQVISRSNANIVVEKKLLDKGLEKCIKFRRNLVFGLKLFDPIFTSKTKRYILLDSDILFFQKPTELLQDGHQNASLPAILFSVDFGFEDSISSQVAENLSKSKTKKPLNAGLLNVDAKSINLERIEDYLDDSIVWDNQHTPNWFAEQAIYDAEARTIPSIPLPSQYQLAAKKNKILQAKSIHYCGSPVARSEFYSKGIPTIFKRVRSSIALMITQSSVE